MWTNKNLTARKWHTHAIAARALLLCGAVTVAGCSDSDDSPDAKAGAPGSGIDGVATGPNGSVGVAGTASTGAGLGPNGAVPGSNASVGAPGSNGGVPGAFGSSPDGSASGSTNGDAAGASGASAGQAGSTGPASIGTVVADDPTPGKYRTSPEGELTIDGQPFKARCGNWFGLEGQHEPKDAEANANGAPLELYIGNMWWVDSGRTIETTMDEIKGLGINLIRLPIAPQTLEANNEQGMTPIWDGSNKNPNGRLKNEPGAYPYATAREALENFIKIADSRDINVLVDIHSCSNFVGWRAGRLDANPPYVDADRVGYDFTREEYSCGGGGQIDHPYNEAAWLENLREIAGLPAAIGVDNIIGIDIFNEPWDYTWDQWATLAEKAYQTISAENADMLVFVEGVGSGTGDGTKVPHGDEGSNPNWGENFWGFSQRPLNIPKNRLVISPHTYGPAVFAQPQFFSGDCAGLEGDGAAAAGCSFDLDPALMRQGWEEHFGYLRDMGYTVIIGEFGGNMDWPKQGTRSAERDMWGHITDTPDEAWQNHFVDYMVEEDIQACYWSINPESADTGGLYKHQWDPVSNESGWGQWSGMDQRKVDLLKRLWGM